MPRSTVRLRKARNIRFRSATHCDRIATKLRFLALTTPEDCLCDEAQGGLGYILSDIADEVAGVADDLREDCDTRVAAIVGKREAQS